MASEILKYLFALVLGSSVGILTVLLTRTSSRHIFGSSASYSLWLLVPIAMLAVLLPHVGSSVSINSRIESVSALKHSVASPSLATAPLIHWQAFALSVWCTGAALFAAYLTAQQCAFVKSLGSLSGSRCALRTSRSDGCPVLLGVLRPKIILPADFESRYTRPERLLIFSHECVHLRRGDAACNGFVALMRCFFWFNPLVHLASSYFRVDQEFACDAVVMRNYPASRRTYGSAMLKAQLADLALPVGCNWRSSHTLKKRVRMLKQGIPTRRRRLFGGIVTASLSLVVGCTTWVAQPPVNGRRSSSAITLHSSAGGPIEITAQEVQYVAPLVMELQGNVRLVVRSEVRTSSDSVRFTGNSEILEGHARLTITGAPHGQAHTEVIFQTDRAILSQLRDGGLIVQFDKGTVQQVPAGDLTSPLSLPAPKTRS